jgi:predicted O-methyltransferase YrrM
VDALANFVSAVHAAHEADPDPKRVRAPDDRHILGELLQPEDAQAPYLQSRDYYAWYWSVAYASRPRTIVELGVRYGYSLGALAAGAKAASPQAKLYLYGFDSEAFWPGSTAVAQAGLARKFPDCTVEVVKVKDLAEVDRLPVVGADLVHCDARHDYEGCKDDLRLALACVRPGGVVLVDDYNFHPEIRKACQEVHAPGGRTVIMHHQGLAVLLM